MRQRAKLSACTLPKLLEKGGTAPTAVAMSRLGHAQARKRYSDDICTMTDNRIR